MAWDSPNDYKLVKTLLCCHSKRLDALWKWYSQGNTQYSYITDWFWQGFDHSRYAPNITIGAWSPVARADSTDPDYLPGGQWQFVSGLHFYPASAVPFVSGLEATLLEELTDKMKWTPIPAWTDIEAALFSQLYQTEPTPYRTSVKEPGYFKVDAVGALLRRRNLVWETTIPEGSVTETYIGAGRIQPKPDDSRPSGEFLSRAFVAVPTPPTMLRLYAIRCGCCVCGK